MKRKGVLKGVLLAAAFAMIAVPVQAKKERNDWKVWEGKLNINEAAETEFILLEGVGDVTAHRIVEYRQEAGGFKSLEQLQEVKGISKDKFKKLEQYLTLFEKSNLKVLIDINSAPVTALKELPRVSKKTASAIVEYRERNDGFKKLEELLQVPGIDRKKFDELSDYVTVRPIKTAAKETP